MSCEEVVEVKRVDDTYKAEVISAIEQVIIKNFLETKVLNSTI